MDVARPCPDGAGQIPSITQRGQAKFSPHWHPHVAHPVLLYISHHYGETVCSLFSSIKNGHVSLMCFLKTIMVFGECLHHADSLVKVTQDLNYMSK